MKRRDVLKGLGLLGVTSLLPGINSIKESSAKDVSSLPKLYKNSPVCWLTPQKTEGPYYFNPNLIRQDISEGKPGVPFRMTINVINMDCVPIPNVMVDIWCADKDGNYSGYNAFVGQTFQRGIQITNGSGSVIFDSIYPGWYPGRATHIHFKVRMNSTTFVTSQFCFPDNMNNEVYATPLYSGRGPNPTTNAMDGVFQNSNPQYLLMDVTANGNGGYNGTYTIGINSPSSVGNPEIEIEGFSLEQNYPNPFNPSTTIVYNIPAITRVNLTVYDVFGKEVVNLVNAKQQAGKYEIKFDASKLSSGYYFYKIVAGDFIQAKEMLLIK